MAPNKDSTEASEGYSQSTKPSSPPSYTDLFAKEHSDNLESSINRNSAVILKVSKLDDNGKPSEVQWKYDEAEQGSYGSQSHNAHGYGIVVTALFIIGEMVGGGIISMPNAMYRQGWAGIAILVILACLSGFTGVQLGKVWMMLQERWPEVYLKHTQKPYPEMGYRAGGVWVRRLVSLCMNLSLFGTATVFLIIISRNVDGLLTHWTHSNKVPSFCLFILIAGCVLLPATYLGSPKDFWQVSFLAAGSTTIAVIIMLVGMSMKYQDNKGKTEYPQPTFVNLILGYGTIIFAYSGQSAFPTIQHDMKRPDQFSKAIVGSYGVMFFYYIPICVFGYIVFGSQLGGKDVDGNDVENVLQLLPKGWCQDIVTVLITLHVCFGFIIFINPINQEVESLCKIPSTFTWKRIVSRTCVVAFIIFLAESIPAMSLLMDLIGGTALAALTFIFPGWFNLKLRWRTTTKVSNADTPIQKWEYPVTAFIMLIGVLGCVASIYAFIFTVTTGDNLFKKPCYVNGGQ